MSTSTETRFSSANLVADSQAASEPEPRIRAALGLANGRLPDVNGKTLRSYYRYLSAQMSFPFEARYPDDLVRDKNLGRVTVVKLLDPAISHGDQSRGILCLTRNGEFLAEVPLADLEANQESPNHQLVEDYWYWFWNWGY
jgi:hypothetical protein